MRAIAAVAAVVCAVLAPVVLAADEVPFRLQADELFVSSDQSTVQAQGSVVVELEGVTVSADRLDLHRDADVGWRFSAAGDVEVSIEGELSLAGDGLSAVLDADAESTFARSLEVETFGGESRFVNSVGEAHTIYFRGETGRVAFDEQGKATLIEVEDAEVTTCSCCGVPLRSQPYTLRARRLRLYPDRLIVVYGLTARIAGVPFFWLPVYAQPLEETLESPLFPAVGRSALRGWYLKWNVPFFVSESLYGSVLLDYFTAFDEIGAGVLMRYGFAEHRGRFRVYHFPAKVGDSVFELSASHSLPPGEVWSGSGNLTYRVEGEQTEIDYGAQASATRDAWEIRVSAERELETQEKDEEEDALERITERRPEISISRAPWHRGSLSLEPRVELGRYREATGEEPAVEALRASASIGLRTEERTIAGVSLTPSLDLQGTLYRATDFEQGRGMLRAKLRALWRNVRAEYDLVLVQGASPFTFDAAAAVHHIGWDVTSHAWGTLTISSGVALDTWALDPLRAQLSWSNWANWTLSSEYSVADATLDSVRLDGICVRDALSLTWSIPYRPAERRLDTVRVTANAEQERFTIELDALVDEGVLKVDTDLGAALPFGPLTFGGGVHFSDLAVTSVSLFAELLTASGWGGDVEWTHRGGTPSFADVRYGLFKDVGECLRVGIDREATDTWLYLSVLAFPEAIIRYAPATSRIQTGE
ncbi:MAG: LPS-assembly protein LptD [Candidatus Bipolaricaulota bacterium]|nr:MAG: LPS-assembly protein LptD [Candidatus Bipolaricaulota bacterium]